MVILDTSTIIDHLRSNRRQETMFEQLIANYGLDEIYISILSMQELFAGKSTRDYANTNAMLRTLSELGLLTYTPEVAIYAGKLMRDTSSVTLGFADAGIAATAIVNKAQLATLNKRHFFKIKGLQLL